MNQERDEQLIKGLERVRTIYQKLQPNPLEMGKLHKRNHNLKCIDLLLESYNLTHLFQKVQVDLAIRIINEANGKGR